MKATLVGRGSRSRDSVVPTQKWESRRPFAGATTGEQFVRCPLIAQMLKDSVVLSHQRVRKHQMAPIQNQTVVVMGQEQKERPEARWRGRGMALGNRCPHGPTTLASRRHLAVSTTTPRRDRLRTARRKLLYDI